MRKHKLFILLFIFSVGCSKKISTISSYVTSHTEQGNYWLEKKQYRYAIKEYSNVLEFSPYHTPALIGIAKVNIETQRRDEAIRFLRIACENDLQNKEPFLELAHLYMKQPEPDYDKAEEVLRGGITYNPRVPEYYLLLGIMYEKEGVIFKQDALLEQSAHLYKKAIDLDKKLGIAHNNLANVLFILKKYDLAEKYMLLAIDNNFPVNPSMKKKIELFQREKGKN